ncbi:MAG: methylated-DNA--[protein]-cysteine S-methyltransferase [Erysipelotrichaceae bacterium]|nr:methylated-DNA--[protein]-cysteine S-methyltransferase [Erysipelotrichaceae bacterium]
MIYSSNYKTPIGDVLIVSNEDYLIGLWFKGQKYFLGNIKEEPIKKETKVILQTKKWLDRYFNGEKPSISEVKLLLDGSEFQKSVWKILCDIPYGEVITYKDISKLLKKEKMSAQAVGGAVGHNPISIIVPCHRVVGSNNSLTGYASGIENKKKLLIHEGIDISKYKE